MPPLSLARERHDGEPTALQQTKLLPAMVSFTTAHWFNLQKLIVAGTIRHVRHLERWSFGGRGQQVAASLHVENTVVVGSAKNSYERALGTRHDARIGDVNFCLRVLLVFGAGRQVVGEHAEGVTRGWGCRFGVVVGVGVMRLTLS